MINLHNQKVRKVVSSIVIIVIVLAMVGGTLLSGLSYFFMG